VTVGVQKAWSLTASDNGSADDNINFAEQQTPASLNNSARALMASVKGWANQISAAKTTGGSSNAYTFTSDSVAAIATSYAVGMAFAFKANHTNTGAATLNVDGVGAKNIRKGGAQAALAANDIVSGGIYLVMYEASGDCFALLNPETGATAQDATLTALAALSWPSGSPLVQFTAADTVSLTLTPSVTSVTVGLGSNTAPSYTFTGDTNTGWFSGGADSIALALGGVTYSQWTTTAFLPGLVTRLPAGAVGSVALCIRTADIDTGFYSIGTDNWGYSIAGSKYWDISASLFQIVMPVQAPIAISSETSGALTGAASRNKQVHCSGNITLPATGMTDGDVILISPRGTARTITRPAAHTMYIAGVDSATGTTGAYNLVTAKFEGSSTWTLQGSVI
jgi:hypothetical protein